MGDGPQTSVCSRARGQEVRELERENDNFLYMPRTYDLHKVDEALFC